MIDNNNITAIINGNIKTMACKEYNAGTILIENGKILSVGDDIEIPESADVIDAEGRMILPGFVDVHSHIGMWEESTGFEGSDGNEITDPVTPQMRAIDGAYPLDPAFEEAYKHGVTTVVTGPGSANVIGGQFFALKTYGHCVDDMKVKDPVAMKCAFGENPKRCYGKNDKSPMTRMAIASIMRDSLEATIDYMNRKATALQDGSPLTPHNRKYEALIPVIKKELPFKVHAHRADDILTAIRIAKEYDLRLTLDHCTDGHLVADEIVDSGFPAVIGPSFGFKSKLELKNKTFETAAILCHKGVKVAIMTDHPVFNQYELPIFAGLAVKSGMTRQEALEAITINPAQIGEIDERVGSIEEGKDADIVIWDNDPLSLEYRVFMTIIDGKAVYKMN